MDSSSHLRLALILAAAAAASPIEADTRGPAPVASIQDIMIHEVDAAADYLWESVGTVMTLEGTEVHQPTTADEWRAAEREAVILTEAANLLMLKNRPITDPGKVIADEGVDGVLTTAEAQSAIDEDRAGFNALALALRNNAREMLEAVRHHDAEQLMNAGDSLQGVCEGCHVRFWYPDQHIPAFPGSR